MRPRGHAFLLIALLVVLAVGCERDVPPVERANPVVETVETTAISEQEENLAVEQAEPNAKPITGVMVSSAQLLPGRETVENGVPFLIAFDEGELVFKSCRAKGFELPRGEVLGVTRFEDLDESQRENLVHEPGWAYYCESADGWNVAWMESPSPDDPIEWAFKRTPRPRADDELPESAGWTIELGAD